MELVRIETPAEVSYVARGGDDLVASESIKIEINGSDFEVKVPEGKEWKVSIVMCIKEFDVSIT